MFTKGLCTCMLFIVQLGLSFSQDFSDSIVIRITNGLIKGKTERYPRDKVIQSFQGIPYAKPPLGQLRFKYPLPAEPWNGVLEATQLGFSCYQRNYNYLKASPGFDRTLPITEFSEDCLTINVYVPLPKPKNQPVMVFIHGGFFAVSGSSAPFHNGASLAAEEGIIVVTLNYRLASLGLLYLNHPDIDTNCGVMDQILALKWIKQNIGFFGGNPQEVTLFGQSAGAMSIGIHMMSPLSSGLFKRAILQSGSPLTDYIFISKDESEKLAYKLGQNLNCPRSTNADSLVKCLRSKPPKQIVEKEPIKKLVPLVFKPIVDGKVIVEDPVESVKKRSQGLFRNMEIMSGITRDEGTLLLPLYQPLVFVPIFDKIGPYHNEFMGAIRFYLDKQCETVFKTIERLYTDWDHFNTTEANFESASTVLKDYFFKCPNEEFTEFYSSMGNEVYSYQFNYRAEAVDYVKWIGVPHTEELRYLMGEVTTLDKYSNQEKQLAFRIMRYWANFARTGNPNISPGGFDDKDLIYWPKFNNNNEVLLLEPNSGKTIKQTESKKCTFWKTTFLQLKDFKRRNMCPAP